MLFIHILNYIQTTVHVLAFDTTTPIVHLHDWFVLWIFVLRFFIDIFRFRKNSFRQREREKWLREHDASDGGRKDGKESVVSILMNTKHEYTEYFWRFDLIHCSSKSVVNKKYLKYTH